MDAVIDLVTFVEEKREQRKITIAAFLEVKGAFDRVTHNAISHALREVGARRYFYAWVKLPSKTYHLNDEGETVDHYVRGVTGEESEA